ncbi:MULTISPECIES: hypothetical protein [unclassified Brevundimonas]|uniref:hypothetical protein n=1 Tax=unclassified Brevundimonas TaxID=2622653 RepID=UPI0025C6C46A|nr:MULTISPECIES: hypothetical protein [unclassified Brevundimonas]
MARLPALVDALVAIDGRERVVIDNVARAVREAGFIQTTKRGRGAAEMTAHDTAALIVGLYGSAGMGDAPRVVEAFSEAKRKHPAGAIKDGPTALGPLLRSRTLLDAVARLVELGPVLDPVDRIGAPAPGLAHIQLTLRRPHLHASIKVVFRQAEAQVYEIELHYAARGAPFAPPYEVATEVRQPIFLTLHKATLPSG